MTQPKMSAASKRILANAEKKKQIGSFCPYAPTIGIEEQSPSSEGHIGDVEAEK